MPILKVLLLAVVQGLTEFLPVSSSGHLLLGQRLLGMEDPQENLTLSIFLHVGSLGAIVAYFFRDFLALLKDRRREILWVFIGSLPAVIVVLALKKGFGVDIDAILSIPLLAGCAFLLNGVFLVLADRVKPSEKPVDGKRALGVGLAQVAGMLPGISRSGSTIGTGLFLGLSPREAVRFSFFLGAVAIFGAAVLKTGELMKNQVELDFLPILLGVIVSFAVSLGAIRVVTLLAERRKLRWFGLYCIGLGLVALGFILFS